MKKNILKKAAAITLAGSMVSGNLSSSAMSYERIEKLGTNGIPDIILISAGCNDW